MSKAFDDWFLARYPTTQGKLQAHHLTNLVALMTEAWQAGAQAALAAQDAEIAALKAERDALRKDAERYRFVIGSPTHSVREWDHYDEWTEADEDQIDAAIAQAVKP